uniref:Nesprin-1 n=1 Tax=Cacopsylla melanoneura TaxID=428564 RepID=A0A8D8Q2T6_9HEMI
MEKSKEKDKTKKDIPQVSPRTGGKILDPPEGYKDPNGTRHVVYSSTSQTSSQTPGTSSRTSSSISREAFYQSPTNTSTPKSSKETISTSKETFQSSKEIRTTKTFVSTRTSTSSIKGATPSPSTSVRETVYTSKFSPRDAFYASKSSDSNTDSKTALSQTKYSSRTSSKESIYSSRTSLSEASSIRPKTSFIEASSRSSPSSSRTPSTTPIIPKTLPIEKTVHSKTTSPRGSVPSFQTLSPGTPLTSSKTLSTSSSSLYKSPLSSPRSPATTPKTPRRHLAEEATPSSTKKLTDKVSYFEHVWSESSKSPSIESLHSTSVSDVSQHSQHDWYPEYQHTSLSNSPRLDYVGSKTHFDSHIAQMRDEQERVQKKTFVNWINSYLSKRIPPLRIDDLTEDLKDGTKLLALLEVLSGDKLPVERGRNLRRPHFLSNANTALQFLQSKKIKLVNINSSDLVDGRPAVVLGLIWTIILYFQIEENTRALAALNAEGYLSPEPGKKDVESAKKTLLRWVSNALPDNIQVKDFGPSWRDGHAFLSVIDNIQKDLVDIPALSKQTNRHRLDTAFNVAENNLGIARLLDPEDVDVERPDEKSVMTYVAQFLHKYPQFGQESDSSQRDIELLMAWLVEQTTYLNRLISTHSLPQNYMEFLAYKNDMLSHAAQYNRHRNNAEIVRLWNLLQNQLKEWEWYLDRLLPPPMNRVGEWLSKAEMMITSGDEIPSIMNEETAAVISRKLEEHKAHFTQYPEIRELFDSVVSQVPAPREQLTTLAERLVSILPASTAYRSRLKFLEHKCCLIAFLHLTEHKLKLWSTKYGRKEHVQALLDQYEKYVVRNKIFQEFNRAYSDMQHVVHEYKTDGNIDGQEVMAVDRFMKETADRWKNVSTELRCVHSMLEELILYWTRWETVYPELDQWTRVAYTKLSLPEDEKLEFFQDLSVWKEKYDKLGDTVSFLVATCEPTVAEQLKNQYLQLSANWDQLYPQIQHYMNAGRILQYRNQFKMGLQQLQTWLRNAEQLLSNKRLPSVEGINQYAHKVQVLSSEIEHNEDILKGISKCLQAMMNDMSRDEVVNLMDILKSEKEALVRVRAQLPTRLAECHQVQVQLEALEMGQDEIQKWLSNAEQHLKSLSLSGGKDNTKLMLERHKATFSKAIYYKSMLESKNKVVQNINSFVECDDLVDKMNQLNTRFNNVTQEAQKWDQALAETTRCWHNMTEVTRVMEEWLGTATRLLSETAPGAHLSTSVETHRSFFSNINDRWIQDLNRASHNLILCLPPNSGEHAQVTDQVKQLVTRWQHVVSAVPVHLMKIEAKQDETVLGNMFREMNQELNAEQQAFNRHEDVNAILERNKAWFVEGERVAEVEARLSKLSQHTEPALVSVYKTLSQEWTEIKTNAQTVRSRVQNIPDLWDQYRAKIKEMEVWMDAVDRSVKSILQDLDSAEQFEKEKLVFQGICREVDSKRNNMKWLVQTLDVLAPHCEDITSEQHLLEKLIQRYKGLIPTIELTITKTQLYTKCYTYTREVREVCSLLDKVKESTADEVDTLHELETLLKSQEHTMSQLDKQRSNIVSMLQRGKQLQVESTLPAVHESVATLETQWNKTYTKSSEALHKLKGEYKTWHSFETQKQDTEELLHKADVTLKQVEQGTLSVAETDVKEEAEDKLKCIQELKVNLRPSVQPEVQNLEKKLVTVIDRMQQAESYQSVEENLLRVKTWIQQDARKVVEQIDTSKLDLPSRLEKMEMLEGGIIEYRRKLADIASKVPPQHATHGNIEVVKQLITTLEQDVSSKRELIEQEIDLWNRYQTGLKQLTPWLDKTELVVQSEMPKPQSLQETVVQLNSAKALLAEVNLQEPKISSLAKLGLNTSRYKIVSNETDALRSRWMTIQGGVEQHIGRLERVQTMWNEFNTKADQIETKLNRLAGVKPVSGTLEQLEKCLVELKSNNHEVTLIQNELSSLSHVADIIGVEPVRKRVQQDKEKALQVSQNLMTSINAVSSTLVASEELQGAMNAFSEWMGSVSPTEESVTFVWEEYEERQPELSRIYEKVKHLEPHFNDAYTELVASYQDLGTKLRQKKDSVEKQAEFRRWYEDMKKQLNHLGENLNDEGEELGNEIRAWKNKGEDKLVNELEQRWIEIRTLVREKRKKENDMKKMWDDFQAVQTKISNYLLAKQGDLEELKISVKKCDDIPVVLTKIDKLDVSPTSKEELTHLGRILLQEDHAHATPVQHILTSIDSNWDKVDHMVINLKDQLTESQSCWKTIQTAQNNVTNILTKYRTIPATSCTDLTSTVNTLGNLQAVQDSMRKNRNEIEVLKNATKTLVTAAVNFPELDVATVEAKTNQLVEEWQTAESDLGKRVQDIEVYVVLWNQIEENKAELLTWLGDTNESLHACLSQPNELEPIKIKLACYKEQLPNYLTLKDNLKAKSAQLVQINPKSEPNTTAINKVIQDGFQEINTVVVKLESLMKENAEKETRLKELSNKLGTKISELREDLMKCDDLTGGVDKIVQRLGTCTRIQSDLTALAPNITELPALRKRYEGVVLHADKIHALLNNYLLKQHNEKLVALKNASKRCQEKLAWCQPEPDSDRYGLEAKLSCLEDVEKGLVECDQKKGELDESFRILRGVVDTGPDQELVNKEVKNLHDSYNKVKADLDLKLKQLEEQDKEKEKLTAWLKTMEDKVKAIVPDMSNVEECKQQLVTIQTEVQQYSPKIESNQQLAGKYEALNKIIDDNLEKLKKLQSHLNLYQKSVKETQKWMDDNDKQLAQFENSLKPSGKATIDYQKKLDELKAWNANKEAGQSLLNISNTQGEALFSQVTLKDRDTIRANLRNLRDNMDALIDKSSVLMKKLESLVIQKSSFDESYKQIVHWLTGMETKSEEIPLLQAKLVEKKSVLQQQKNLSLDVTSHEAVIKKLSEKTQTMNDAEATSSMEKVNDKYKTLCKTIQNKLKTVDTYVKEHEEFLSSLEKFKDFYNSLANEEQDIAKEDMELQLPAFENLLKQQNKGDELLQTCAIKLDQTLKTTAEPGHEALKSELEHLKKLWNDFLMKCNDSCDKLKEQFCSWNQLENEIEELNTWVKDTESKIKEQSLKNSKQAKQDHLVKMKSLEQEIINKANEVKALQEKSLGAKPHVVDKLSKAVTRYHNLKTNAKEAILKYEAFIKDHENFDEQYKSLVEWIDNMRAEKNANSDLKGDLADLQERQKKMLKLGDLKTRETGRLESVIELGEHIYTHTSPDGRDIIRQQLRNLRLSWDNLSEEIESSVNKLEQCLLKFTEFSVAQEQLTKWLKDVEKAIEMHTQLKSTLQEKQAQLQNHKLKHQEIIGNQAMIEAVCDKATQLLNQTQDTSLNEYPRSIKNLFQNIVAKSKDLQDNLESNVAKHTGLRDSCAQLRVWIQGEKEKLDKCDDMTGEKVELLQRLDACKTIKANVEPGKRKLEALKQLANQVGQSTTKKGNAIIKKDIDELEAAFNEHSEHINDITSKLDLVLAQWAEFGDKLDQLTQWFRTVEPIFKDEQLQASLEQKQAQLEKFAEQRVQIEAKEKDVDGFMDKSHCLLHQSGVDRIKPLISQISNRYQLLHVMSKEVINRWQGLVYDHKLYDDVYVKTDDWLTNLEKELDTLKNTTDVEVKNSLLQKLLTEKDQAGHKLTYLTSSGEKLYLDTAAKGREVIRQQLRTMRDRCDELEAGIKEEQKSIESQFLQWNSFRETLAQMTAWLDSVEKNIKQEMSTPWTTTQELRSKLLKLKTTLQEVLSHKRIIESLLDKSKSLPQINKDQALEKAIVTVNKRYEDLVDGILKSISQLEESLDIFQQFQQLQKAYQEDQKQLWDKLSTLTDYSGNKQALQARLDKLNGIQDSFPEISNKLQTLSDHIENSSRKLPSRTNEAMYRDLANLRYDFEKCVSSLSDVKQGLESRIAQWTEYETSLGKLISWLNDTETVLKNFTLQPGLSEKKQQLNTYQSLLVSLRATEASMEKLGDDTAELVRSSGETKLSVSVQQFLSRFLAVQNATKEILKKCEKGVSDHESFVDKYDETSAKLAQVESKYNKLNEPAETSYEELQKRQLQLAQLLTEKVDMDVLLNTTVDMCDKVYESTAEPGHKPLREQMEKLQQAVEALYDRITVTERELKGKLSSWCGYEESVANLLEWLKVTEKKLGDEIELKTTLDEKKGQLQVYRTIYQDATSHQQDLLQLKDKIESLHQPSEQSKQQLTSLTSRHANVLKRAQKFTETYEGIVSIHQAYTKAVLDTQEWIDATYNAVNMWGDLTLERVSLHSNLERLKNLEKDLENEEPRIKTVREMGEKVLPGTVESGRANIHSQIDSSQQDWEGLVAVVKSTVESVEKKLEQWMDYERMKDDCAAWLRDTDSKLHAIDLKSTGNEKRQQLEELVALQGEVRAKELEIDCVTEKAQQLQCRSSPMTEIAQKYHKICVKVKDLNTKWQQYVNDELEWENHSQATLQWLDNIRTKLDYCCDLSASSQKDLENKLETIQALLMYKEEGFNKVQKSVALAQVVLTNTKPEGHVAINNTLTRIQEDWSNLASKMVETKVALDDSIHKWAGFLEQIQELNQLVEYIQVSYNELSPFQATMAEKRAQLEKIKLLEDKVRCETVEVDSLKVKAGEMLASGQQSQAATQAKQILDQFDTLLAKVKSLLADREDQYKDHRVYKEACDELLAWLTRARDKIPSMKQKSLSDKLAIENIVAPLETLLNKKAQGELLVEHMQTTGEVVLASTSPDGQTAVRSEMKALAENFDTLFKEIKTKKDKLEGIVGQWREYKDEYEKTCDWLQQMDILVKAKKTALLSTVQEKENQVEEMKDVMTQLYDGEAKFKKLNELAADLLTSHLDTYVSNQLQHINSRYQVQINLAKDVQQKVETNFKQHKEYLENLKKANDWIENAKEIISTGISASHGTSKEELQSSLAKVQDLLRNREQGQSYIHATVNCGDKVMRNTKSDGKEVIQNQLKELQAEWDRLIKKLSTAKVRLETSLLDWADYNSSYSQLQQWISEREAKLQQVSDQKIPKAKVLSQNIGDKKSNLRQTNSIVQDIVSFEPMIQSVTSKAETLQGAHASDITSKYENLSKAAKDLYNRQKEMVEQHEAFIDASIEFNIWLRDAKEKLGKCSEPTGDKESLSSKSSLLKVLFNELKDGQEKLEKALKQGEVAVRVAVEESDKEVIEEEVAVLQDEYDNYADALNRTKKNLEVGIVKWTEFEENYKEAEQWLSQTDAQVQSYNKLQNGLEEKRIALERFQLLLQTLFDWQKDLDRLNMKAQTLLETCADTRVSNAITQMATKYNTLLSIAKEIMRRLEMHYQEHQQHSALYQECQDWVDKTREKLNECSVDVPASLTDVTNRLATVNSLKQSLEQGQNKVRYVLELKERVAINTQAEGAAKINEDTAALEQEFETLVTDLHRIRQDLIIKQAQLQDVGKSMKTFIDWLTEMEQKAEVDELMNSLSEKKAAAERFKILNGEALGYADSVKKLEQSSKEVEPYVQRYETLKKNIAEAIQKFEAQATEHEAYKQAYNEACDWLRKARLEAQANADCHGDQQTTKNKANKIKQILGSLKDGQALIDKTIALKNNVLESTGSVGKENINKEINQMNTDFANLQNTLQETDKHHTQCLTLWDNFLSTKNNLEKWIEGFQKKIDSEKDIGDCTNLDDLEKYKALLQEVIDHNKDMEVLNDKCEELMELAANSPIREETLRLQTLYAALLTSVQGLVSQVEKNLSDQTEFLAKKEEVEAWLQKAHATVQSCAGNGSKDVLKQRLDTVTMVAEQITEGQHLMSVLQDTFTKALDTTPSDQQDSLRDAMTALRDSWDRLNRDLKSTTTELKSAIARWNELDDLYNRFNMWLTGVENKLNEPSPVFTELGDMKTVLERSKHIVDDIEKKKDDLKPINKEAEQLSEWDTTIVPKVKDLEQRWNVVRTAWNSKHSDLSSEIAQYTAYQNAVQDAEKWLLQISFQLMAHNSLYINNQQQTLEQIQHHEKLLQDVINYQTNIDELKEKGKKQIERYEASNPEIRPAIQLQLDNVQESYNSLLETANQIKNRLLDSLNKFQEYEDALNSIWKVLEQLEPEVMEPYVEPNTLDHANQAIQKNKDLLNKLEHEKNRLGAAIQAGEAATACISRPSSPLESAHPPVPDREIAIRLRLEDQIEQVESKLSQLAEAKEGLEGEEKLKADVLAWIAEQKSLVTDWEKKPCKIKTEQAQAEIARMQDLKGQILRKQTEGICEEELGKVIVLINAAIAKKDGQQAVIESYKADVSELEKHLDSIGKKLDSVEHGQGVLCPVKASTLNSISTMLEESVQEPLSKIQTKAEQVRQLVSNLDQQFVDEQLKSVERHVQDLKKRTQRRRQTVDTTLDELNLIRNEFATEMKSIESMKNQLNEPVPAGEDVNDMAEYLQSLQSLHKEADNKKVLIDSFNKKIIGLTELEPEEVKDLIQVGVHGLQVELNALLQSIEAEINKVANAAQERKAMQDKISKLQAWLKQVAQVQVLPAHEPLASVQCQVLFNTAKEWQSKLKEFKEKDLKDAIKQSKALLAPSSADEGSPIKDKIERLEKEHKTQSDRIQDALKTLNQLIGRRKEFETDVESVEAKLKELEVAVEGDVKTNNVLMLQEILNKYAQLNEDAGECNMMLSNVRLATEHMNLNEPDRLTVTDTVNSLQTRYALLSRTVEDRIAAVTNKLQTIKRLQHKVEEAKALLTKAEALLSKPVSTQADDITETLQNYQKLLDEINGWKNSQSDDDLADLQDSIKPLDEIVDRMESHAVPKLKSLLLLREQFTTLILQIVGFITEITARVAEVEPNSGTVKEKIDKYDKIIQDIQEYEAILATASDKGDQLAQDGTISDRNEITEQLQSRKQQLHNLRKTVEKLRQQSEKRAAESEKLVTELEDIIEALHARETAVKTLPLLQLEVTSVDVELDKTRILEKEIKQLLDKGKKIQDKVKNQDSTPDRLKESLSELTSLKRTLPEELKSRETYLNNHKIQRKEYEALVGQFNSWLNEADKFLAENSAVNIVDITAALEKHNKFFECEPTIHELVGVKLKDKADIIATSLAPPLSEELNSSLQELKQKLRNLLNNARSRQASLEQTEEVYRTLQSSLDKARSLISSCQVEEEPVASLQLVHANIQKLTHACNRVQENQPTIDLLNDVWKEIKPKADQESETVIEDQIDKINEQWNTLVADLDTRREKLTDLAEQWEQLDKLISTSQTVLKEVENQVEQCDGVVHSVAMLTQNKSELESLKQTVDSEKANVAKISTMAAPIVKFLKKDGVELQKRVDSLVDTQSGLAEHIAGLLSKLAQDWANLHDVLRNSSQLIEQLTDLKTKVDSLYAWGDDSPKQLKELTSFVNKHTRKVKDLSKSTQEAYVSSQGVVPADLVQEINALELLSEDLNSLLEQKGKEVQKAKTMRAAYLSDVEKIGTWLNEAEAKIQDRTLPPQTLIQFIQQLEGELVDMKDRLAQMTRTGNEISSNTQSEQERALIQSTILSFTEQMNQIEMKLNERKKEVTGCDDAWKHFLSLHADVIKWVTEKRIFLSEPYDSNNLSDLRVKLNSYTNAVRSCTHVNALLTEMNKELEQIANSTGNVGDLSEKLDQADALKTEVEAMLIERNAALSETCEEWDQCEKKLKEAQVFAEKTQGALQSLTGRRKALRDQHLDCETIVADIAIQKEKIVLSIEKLEVHLKRGVGDDALVNATARDILAELDNLNDAVRKQITDLEQTIFQVEHYQQEIQQLHQQVSENESQLRTMSSPLVAANALSPHQLNACSENIRVLQSKIAARMERIKLLLQRGTPDAVPLV